MLNSVTQSVADKPLLPPAANLGCFVAHLERVIAHPHGKKMVCRICMMAQGGTRQECNPASLTPYRVPSTLSPVLVLDHGLEDGCPV
jgi:hypothetical protein